MGFALDIQVLTEMCNAPLLATSLTISLFKNSMSALALPEKSMCEQSFFRKLPNLKNVDLEAGVVLVCTGSLAHVLYERTQTQARAQLRRPCSF